MKRIKLNDVKPTIYNPLIELNNSLKSSTLSVVEYNLIYVRGSQINGCAYCTHSHIADALAAGESQGRINALVVWEDSECFSESESIILQMTEEITRITEQGLSEIVYRKAIELLGEVKVADVIMAVASINAWTRLGRATKLKPMAIN